MKALTRGLCLLAMLCLLGLGAMAAAQQVPPAGKNRLAFETSPYLLQHAENPVDWYPWGEEAFARARTEGKPIFLSIGYSTCYWCQVMERESFADPATAELLNRSYISVKVDREERPDIDAIYMAAVVGMTGSGGWPMSVVLTPELEPFFAGTYFPNESFKDLLGKIQRAWSSHRAELEQMAGQIAEGIRNSAGLEGSPAERVPGADLIDAAAEQFEAVFDQLHGGFGRAPKFPQPAILELLMSHYQQSGSSRSLAMVRQTLDAMARGGVHDQLGGGFHRYSTDRRWLVPHFEKMLYDNGQLLHAYARAYELTGDGYFRRLAEQIADYVQREMTGPRGLFYSAQDSGVDEEEGRPYIWSPSALRAALSDEDYAFASRVFGVDGDSNFEGGYILYWPSDYQATAQRLQLSDAQLFERLDRVRTGLLAVRRQFDQPRLDDKSIAAWNGIMIEALAFAGQTLKRPDYVGLAEAAAGELLRTLRDSEGNLLHVARNGKAKLSAYLDDYAAVILGLMELHRVTGNSEYRTQAAGLAEVMIEKLWDPAGGFHYAQPSVDHLLARLKDTHDGAFPTGNSLAVRALVKLARSGFERYVPYAAVTLRAYAANLENHPRTLAYMLWGLYEYRQGGFADDVVLPKAVSSLPRTSDLVRIEARVSHATLTLGQEVALEVVVSVDPGWHINSNPASLAALVPTSLEAELFGAELRVALRYPPGHKIPSGLGGTLEIYRGQVKIPAAVVPYRLPEGPAGGILQVRVRAQACNQTGRCLIPATLEARIPVRFASIGQK